MSNDISANVELVDELSNSINRDITEVKENLGLLIVDRRGIDIYNGLGYIVRLLDRIDEMELRIGRAAKDMKKELEEDQDHN